MSIATEIKRCEGLVMQREAELQSAKEELIEARKQAWVPIPFADLLGISRKYGREFNCLAEHDWLAGRFEYQARVSAGETKVNIGGFWDNDRFRRSETVFIPNEVYEETK